MDFQATPELRYLKRQTLVKVWDCNYVGETEEMQSRTFLQQKWTHTVKAYGTGEVLEEWRDVPIVEE